MATDQRYQRITAEPPRMDEDRQREILRTEFDVSPVAVRPLAGETDRNLWVADGSGTEYVLKICAASEEQTVRFQAALLRHLAERDPDLPVPRVVPGTAGTDVVACQDGTLARLLTWLPGTPLAEVPRYSPELLADVGTAAGRLTAATGAWQPPYSPEPHYWEFPHAGTVLADARPADPDLRAAVTGIHTEFVPLLDRLPDLPHAVVHHDLNAFNVLLERHGPRRRVSGLIDFGDALRTARVADLAVLLSSAMRGSVRPLRVAELLTAAYHAACPLTEAEIDLVFPLVAIRAAAVAATTARLASAGEHGDPRHRSPAAAALARALARIPAAVGTGTIRRACGLPAGPDTAAVTGWLADNAGTFPGVLRTRTRPVDLSAGSPVFDEADPRDPAALRTAAHAAIEAARPAVPVTRYGEPRFLAPARRGTATEEPATIPTGVDLFTPGDEPVFAPVAGTVETAGPDVVLRHEPAAGIRFWTGYTGLVTGLEVGTEVTVGQRIGTVRVDAEAPSPPRLGIRLSTVPVTSWSGIPALVPLSEAPVWQELLPDPTGLLGEPVAAWSPAIDRVLDTRAERLPAIHPTYYDEPITMVRARDCWFYDEHGRSYLDSLNNVTLLGHGHPRLVDAATRQLRRLNTNSRFVYEVLAEYADALTATLPDGLDVVYFVNSGSEANDLALRMARHVSGRQDVVIIDDAYHGYTATVADVSPSRYRHYGRPDTTHPTPVPDRYRGPYGYADPHAGERYAGHVVDTFERLTGEGRAPAAFLFESLLAGAGQIVLPPGYLAPVFAAARQHGAFTIADEVQVGFGRLGERFWGFQTQGPELVPDFVTMGKSMGNGFPVAALVTTRAISQAFDASGRFFSTYGGNPVACAVGLELLRTLEAERLQDNALHVGQYFRDRLAELAATHELIGDVRGQGFYSGVELVRDRGSKEPAPAETLTVCERLKEEGILVYPTGPHGNVLKLKPPLTFTRGHADDFSSTLDQVLEAGW